MDRLLRHLLETKGRSPIRRTKRTCPPRPLNQAKTLPKPLLRLAAPNEENTLNRQKNAVTMTTKSNNSAGDVFDKSGNPTSTPPQIKAPIRPYARLRARTGFPRRLHHLYQTMASEFFLQSRSQSQHPSQPKLKPKPKPSRRDDEAMLVYKLHKGGSDMGFKRADEYAYVREEWVSKYPRLVMA